MIRFIALGTSATFPTETRNHPGFFFEYQGIGFLFDVGENIQRQMRIAKISPKNIDYIFITHWHGDHILGLPGVLFNLTNSEYNKTLRIVLPKEHIEDLKNVIYSFKIPIRFDIELIGIDKDGVVIENRDFMILAKEVRHNIKCYAYKFIQKDYWKFYEEKIKEYKINRKFNILRELKKKGKVKIDGKIIKISDVGWLKKGFVFTYITDTIFFKDLTEFAQNSDILLIESSYINESELAKEHYHMTFEEAYDIYRKSNSNIMLVTHLSQRYEKSIEDIEKYINGFEGNIFLLRDFDGFVYKKDIIEININKKIYRFYRDPKGRRIKKLD